MVHTSWRGGKKKKKSHQQKTPPTIKYKSFSQEIKGSKKVIEFD